MKAILRTVWIIAGLAGNAQLSGQGTVFLNNYDSGMGVYWSPGVAAPAGTRIVVEGGRSPPHMAALQVSTGFVFTITAQGVDARGPGSGSYFDVGSAAVPDVPPGGTAFFEVVAWWGSSNYGGTPYEGTSLVWSQPVGTADSPVPLNIPNPIYLTISEPGSMSLLVVGALVVAWRVRNRCRICRLE